MRRAVGLIAWQRWAVIAALLSTGIPVSAGPEQVQVIAAPTAGHQLHEAAGESPPQPSDLLDRAEPPEAGVSVDGDVPASQPAFEHWLGSLVVISLAVAGLYVIWRYGWHRLDTAPLPSRPGIAPEVAVVLVLAMYLSGVLGMWVMQSVAGIEWPASDSQTDAATQPSLSIRDTAMLYSGHAAAQLVIVAVYAALRRRGQGREAAPARLTRGRAAAMGAAMLLASFPTVMLVGALAGRLLSDDADPIAHDTLRDLVHSDFGPWHALMSALVVLLAPALEEVMYRGLLQRGLVDAGLPRWPVILAVSGCFAFMHGGIAAGHALLSLFVLSIALGLVYERTGRLTAPIVMHVLFNAINLALGLLVAG